MSALPMVGSWFGNSARLAGKMLKNGKSIEKVIEKGCKLASYGASFGLGAYSAGQRAAQMYQTYKVEGKALDGEFVAEMVGMVADVAAMILAGRGFYNECKLSIRTNKSIVVSTEDTAKTKGIDAGEGGLNSEEAKVTATFEHKGNVYYDVNPTARDRALKNDTLIPGPDGQKGLSNINNTTNKAHAEIGAMNQSRTSGNTGGNGVLTVTGQPICNYCRSDIKKMAIVLDLDKLTVNEMSTGKTYTFCKSTGDFFNVKDGGKRWE